MKLPEEKNWTKIQIQIPWVHQLNSLRQHQMSLSSSHGWQSTTKRTARMSITRDSRSSLRTRGRLINTMQEITLSQWG